MKVHFAAGVHPFPRPWRNLDVAPGRGITDVVDLLDDDWPDDLVDIDTAYVGHFLEHLTLDECVTFLSRVRERMAPNGRLIVVGPDVKKGNSWHGAGRIPDELWARIQAHGEIDPERPHERGDDVHVWDCHAKAVVDLIYRAGWSYAGERMIGDFREWAPRVPVIDLSGWQFSVLAYAGADRSTS